MKNITHKLLGSLAAVACAASSAAHADILTQWTFETSIPAAWTSTAGVTGTTPGMSFAPEITNDGAIGSATASHASATSVWAGPAGNGSTRALSGTAWAVGDYFQFAVTPGLSQDYSTLNVSYGQNGSGTGPGQFYFAYSTDGVAFTQVGANYSLASGVSWGSTGAPKATQLSFNLGSYTDLTSALDLGSTVYFRIVDASTTSISGGTVGTGGTDRVDDFTVSTVAVPEPSSFALGGCAALLLGLIRRRK